MKIVKITEAFKADPQHLLVVFTLPEARSRLLFARGTYLLTASARKATATATLTNVSLKMILIVSLIALSHTDGLKYLQDDDPKLLPVPHFQLVPVLSNLGVERIRRKIMHGRSRFGRARRREELHAHRPRCLAHKKKQATPPPNKTKRAKRHQK